MRGQTTTDALSPPGVRQFVVAEPLRRAQSVPDSEEGELDKRDPFSQSQETAAPLKALSVL